MNNLLFNSLEWDFPTIEKTWNIIDSIAKEKFQLDYYVPQIEVISAEQMLNAYSTIAMPIMYDHWSFGKSFVQNEKAYKKGKMGLAYEVVINTNPLLTYLMEDNSMTMQTLVLAHAACGHGSFFKNNYLFKEWTDADAILDYLKFAKNYIKKCEEKYGSETIEKLLDACHSIKYYGVDKYKRPTELKKELVQQRKKEWVEYFQDQINVLWSTVPDHQEKETNKIDNILKTFDQERRSFPEENLLYFLEKYSPILKEYEKEIVRIVRKVSQYFYPQMQTQLMNEGWACFIHYHLMLELHKQGYITDGSWLEFIRSHTAVIKQPQFNQKSYNGINVYALGFAMMMDIKRICQEPDKEDEKWFPDIVHTDWLQTLKDIVVSYKDESFILQFLSPKIIRKFKLFTLEDNEFNASYKVKYIHDDEDILNIRKALSKQYSFSRILPQIEVTGVDWDTDRTLNLQYISYDGKILHYQNVKKTLSYLEKLWGFNVQIEYVDNFGKELLRC